MRHSQAFQLSVTGSVGIAVARLLWTPNSALSAQGGQAPLSQVVAP